MGYIDGYEDDFYTKNRRLVLEEYDEQGNLIDARDMGKDGIANLVANKIYEFKGLEVARIEILNQFTDEELKEIHEFIRLNNTCLGHSDNGSFFIGYITDRHVELFKELMSVSKEEREFIYECMNEQCCGRSVMCAMGTPNLPIHFHKIREYVRTNEGIYYAMSTTGELKWRYDKKPTKKQANYQRTKNGNKIILRSFRDWRYHDISEAELE